MASSGPIPGRPDFPDFARSPFLVIWETTQACDLACVHCRAEARPGRDPGELSTLEAMRLMNEVRRFGRPLFVLTGGDPFKRPDLVHLVAHGARLGLRMGLTPSATPLVTRDALLNLRDAGLARLAISIDGATSAEHDEFRKTPGSFRRSLEILRDAREIGLSTQVNTTVARGGTEAFDAMARLVPELGVDLWSVFFLVPVGRADMDQVPTPDETEAIFHRMYELGRPASFDIKSTAAPHYRRLVLQRQVEERRRGERSELPGIEAGAGFSLGGGRGRAQGVNDGNGFVFVSHRGDIFPSGFLPLAAGNVRVDDVVEVYRESGLFRSLRDPDRFGGKCGVCEFRTVCGGSRARAWATTGDPLAAEPSCAHIPRRWARMSAAERAARSGAGRTGERFRLPVVSAAV